MNTILVTGSEGLVGSALCRELRRLGYRVNEFDIKGGNGHEKKDINNFSHLKEAIENVDGIVHLAAISRVIWGVNNPELCVLTNEVASKHLLSIAAQSKKKPWCLVSSSREVYGEAQTLPVTESNPLKPVNIYGRSKLAMETATLAARNTGLNTAIVRLANVYGSIDDHPDRVLPAFCRNAVLGSPLRVDGRDNLFDFTHLSDTISGLTGMIEMLIQGEKNLPPIHLLPGIGTTLYQAAEYAVSFSKNYSDIVDAPSRNFDVSRFVGNPQRAKTLLGWEAHIHPEQGIELLVNAFKSSLTKEK